MQTYNAALTPWRLKPLHDIYVALAHRHAALIRRNGGAIPNYRAVCCPYCGAKTGLKATVRVGSKKQIDDLDVTEDGYAVPTARGAHVELLLLKCTYHLCKAIIDPLAYHSPATFYSVMQNVSLFDEHTPGGS